MQETSFSIPPERLFLCFGASDGQAFPECRYLVIPGFRSLRFCIFDVKGPLKAKFHKAVELEEEFAQAGYARPVRSIAVPTESLHAHRAAAKMSPKDRRTKDKQYNAWWILPRDDMVDVE